MGTSIYQSSTSWDLLLSTLKSRKYFPTVKMKTLPLPSSSLSFFIRIIEVSYEIKYSFNTSFLFIFVSMFICRVKTKLFIEKQTWTPCYSFLGSYVIPDVPTVVMYDVMSLELKVLLCHFREIQRPRIEK